MLFIFDWDGTLCDSTAIITLAMQQAAQELGWDIPEDHEVHNIIGLGLPEAVAQLYPQTDAKACVELQHAYRRRFLELDAKQPPELFPSVQETLECLRQDGHSLAIATSKSRAGLERMLTGLGMASYFHGSRCADETASKPHPLMLNELLTEFATPAAEAVMIGDTEYDMAMARAIAMPRIAVSYGAHCPERLHLYEPELCVDRLSQILQWRGCR